MEYNFIDDHEKMRDFKEMNRGEFLVFYSYLTEEEYDATLEAYAKESVHGLVMKAIYDWVNKLFGQYEADNPGWNIPSLAREIASHEEDIWRIAESNLVEDDIEMVASEMNNGEGVELTSEQLKAVKDAYMKSDAWLEVNTPAIEYYINEELEEK